MESIRDNIAGSFKAVITDRYPVEDTNTTNLPEGLPLFCFPNDISLSAKREEPKFHAFVHTSEEGYRMLGCCLIFYEPIPSEILGTAPEERPIYMPRCLCLSSSWTFVSSFKCFLCGIYDLSLRTKCPIPLERYICNFIDEVPAPPPGRIDVHYYLDDHLISFRSSAMNEPHVWFGMPLFPLFECLSVENVLILFALLLTERQVLFISSQFSLLTTCAEAITSLLYPLTWAHAYIPILPRQLLGVLGAPFPFILGVHSSITTLKEFNVGEETVRIYLDSNHIDLGVLGMPPPLPERRARKLSNRLFNAEIFEKRGTNWTVQRLPNFDVAHSKVMECPECCVASSNAEDLASGAPPVSVSAREGNIRSAFLQFFVAILKNYRKNLIYGTLEDPDPMIKFQFDEFLEEHPADWQPLLSELIYTQAFSQFVDKRILEISHDSDVLFFDESIDAKMNRYTFRMRSIDTPFLREHGGSKHTKTFVPPTVNATNIPVEARDLVYRPFPSLKPELYSPSRGLPPSLHSDYPSIHLSKLKRSNPTPNAVTNGNLITSATAVYSCYLVVLANLVCYVHSQMIVATHKASRRPTILQLLEEFPTPNDGGSDEVSSSISRSKSFSKSPMNKDSASSIATADKEASDASSNSNSNSVSNDTTNTNGHTGGVTSTPHALKRSRSPSNATPMTRLAFQNKQSPESAYRRRSESESDRIINGMELPALVASAKLGLKVALEVLNCLSRMDEPADDATYRALVDACGALGFSREVVDLLVHMHDEGLLPDNPMLSSVAKAVANDQCRISVGYESGISSARSQGSGTGKEATASISAGAPVKWISPAEVWIMQDWQWRSLQLGEGSLYRRKLHGAMTPEQAAALDATKAGQHLPIRRKPPVDRAEIERGGNNDGALNWLWTSKSGADSPIRKRNESSDLSAFVTGLPAPRPTSIEVAYYLLGSGAGARYSFPKLQWKFCDLLPILEHRGQIFQAVEKLARHMIIAEQKLCEIYENLEINLMHPMGQCPCPKTRCLTLEEIYAGWDTGNPNKYTATCIVCGREFVPRFTVESTNRDWMGSEGAKSPLWCELLSPWTLRKELFNILFQEGIESILSQGFRNPAGSSQHAVIFWNTVIVFRLYGLPYTFLLCGMKITDAFPPRKRNQFP